jgi:hypothetical protein
MFYIFFKFIFNSKIQFNDVKNEPCTFLEISEKF